MYVTRKISDCRRRPELLEISPAGPFSGVLVIQDEEAEAEATSCFGLCKTTSIDELPIPQNKTITISYSTGSGENSSTSYDYVMLIPVPNRPLSANIYYAIQAKGKRQGEAHTSSTEEDLTTCCFSFCTFINDVKSRPLEPGNPLQQFELFKHPAACSSFYGFECKSVSPGAFPPHFLRREGWRVDARTPKDFTLGEAHGVDAALRGRLPEFKFPISDKSSAGVVVGKWYVPFMFVKESSVSLKEQMKKSMYYEMVLEQRWEKVFEAENAGEGKAVKVDADVETEAVQLGGSRRVVVADRYAADGFVWYTSDGSVDEGRGVGLSSGIVEMMKWEQKRGGWDGSSGKVVLVDAAEEVGWSKFACYVLVESFALKRMDGTLVINFDFYYTHQTKCTRE